MLALILIAANYFQEILEVEDEDGLVRRDAQNEH
jgi:hypothetical protein